MTRTIYCVPIMHHLSECYDSWNKTSILNQEYHQYLEIYWDNILEHIRPLSVQKIYQDGYTEGTDLSKVPKNTPNTIALERLISQGIQLMPTESLELLKQESTDTLELRDKYIANQINQTLNDTENAILFIGAGHSSKYLLELTNLNCEKLSISGFDKLKGHWNEMLWFSH